MNIYCFELKKQVRSFLQWTLVLLLVLIACMAVVYPIYYDSRNQVIPILNGFPPEFTAALGLSPHIIFSYGGFYSFASVYLLLLGTIMASTLAFSVFGREKKSKCTDFLLAKPVKRRYVFLAKFSAVLTLLVVTNLLYLLTSFLLYASAGEDGSLTGRVLLASGSLFFTQLLFFSTAVFAAVYTRRIRSVSNSAMALGFAALILTVMSNIMQERFFRFIAPLKYFNVEAVFKSGQFEWEYVLTAALITFFLMTLSFFQYCKEDIPAQ